MKKFFHKTKNWFKNFLQEDDVFIIFISLLFYLFLSFSPNNKTFLLVFVLFFYLLNLKIKDKKSSLFLLLILVLPFIKGKSFSIPMVPVLARTKHLIFNYNFDITFADLAVLGVVFLVIWERLTWRKKFKPKFSFGKRDFFLFAFIAAACFSEFFSQFPVVSVLSLIKFLRAILIYFLYRPFLQEKKIKRFVPLVLASSLFFEGIWSSLQFIFQKPLGRSIESFSSFVPLGITASEDVSFFRPQGTFDHPNTLGSFAVWFLLFLFLQLCNPAYPPKIKTFFTLSLLAGGLALIFSAGRANWMVLALLAIFLIIGLRKKNLLPKIQKKKLVYLSLFLLIFFPLLVIPRLKHFYLTFSSGGGYSYRQYLNQKAYLLFLDLPFGIGLSAFPGVLMREFNFGSWPASVHNLFLEILVEIGIFGLAFFLAFLLCLYRDFFIMMGKLKQSPGSDYFLRAGAAWAVFGFLATSNFYPTLSTNNFQYLWLFLGLMLY